MQPHEIGLPSTAFIPVHPVCDMWRNRASLLHYEGIRFISQLQTSPLFRHKVFATAGPILCTAYKLGMQQLRANAEAKSGVPYTAVEIARSSGLFERLGIGTFRRLSERFYDNVFSDEQLRFLFANTTREHAIQNQYEFLVQEFGGPQLYTQRKGHTAILGRHAPYPFSHSDADRWLAHMNEAIGFVQEIDPDSKQKLRLYFQHMASFIVYGKELVNPRRTVGYYGKHREGEV